MSDWYTDPNVVTLTKGRAPKPCDLEFHPMANALAFCTCGYLVGHHKMAEVDLAAEARQAEAYYAAMVRQSAEPTGWQRLKSWLWRWLP